MNEATETGLFRSRLNALPIDLKCMLGEIPLQKGMRPTSRKEMALEALDKFKIPFIEIGTGTNRFIVKYDGYVIKIALDNEGIADNIQEFAICESLMPDVAYAHEISTGGHLLVASYCPAFTSANEMWTHHTKIKSILKKWSQRYLLGDVGITDYNYANWGIAPGGQPVCIDYAYIFPADLDLIKCICGSKRLEPFSEYSKYKCPICGTVYEDREIRAKIDKETRFRLFKNAEGIIMKEEYENHPVDPKYIRYTRKPDGPDPFETALATARYLNNQGTEFWKGSASK